MQNKDNPASAFEQSAAKRVRVGASIFKDLEKLQQAIPKFDLYEDDVASWISTVKGAVQQYESPNDIMQFLHSFFVQDRLITWYIKQKHGKSKLEDFKDSLEAEVTSQLIRDHELADLHFDAFLGEMKYTGAAKVQTFLKEKFLLFANLYPFFPKDRVAEKIFFQLSQDLIPEFLPYRKAKVSVILKCAAVTDGVTLAE